MALRVVFMGTPDFAVPSLRAVAAAHDVIAVYSQPPRPAGRGKTPRPGPVHEAALALGIPVHHPLTLKDADAQAAFAALGTDIAVVAAYGLILPVPVLEAPRLGCVNVHASLLPRWRGAAPIQRAILAGDAETGVCIMGMEKGLDTGPVFLREAIPIGPDEDAGSLHDRLAALGARLLGPALEGIAAGTLMPRTQPEAGVTYAAKLSREEEAIDFAAPAELVLRRIRAFAPAPGAYTEFNGTRLKILRAALAVGSGAPGETLDDHLAIACGQGAIRARVVQRAGAAAMEAEAFLRGIAVPKGTVLGPSAIAD